jgi:glycosyltransferase involved in cell wall biosynthesis
MSAYVAWRHRGNAKVRLAGGLLDGIFRRLARRAPLVVVGPDLARRYAAAPRLLEAVVTVVPAARVGAPRPDRSKDARRTLLTVTRLDPEKNPLLLADVLAELGPEWRLVVCGDGPLRDALADRLAERGLATRATLAGYVSGAELRARYEAADVFLHVSWTEGLPQVLFEAFAAGLPTVATAVGGVAASVGDAALLVSPGDACAAAEAVRAVGKDPELADRLRGAGEALAREHSLEAESAAVARFIRAGRAAVNPVR